MHVFNFISAYIAPLLRLSTTDISAVKDNLAVLSLLSFGSVPVISVAALVDSTWKQTGIFYFTEVSQVFA